MELQTPGLRAEENLLFFGPKLPGGEDGEASGDEEKEDSEGVEKEDSGGGEDRRVALAGGEEAPIMISRSLISWNSSPDCNFVLIHLSFTD